MRPPGLAVLCCNYYAPFARLRQLLFIVPPGVQLAPARQCLLAVAS
ncbi:hypothetical protein Paride_0407 [Pseudomonas phage Paride]|nr:hypothetical protein Paride_0407 [Pseudomonas phage Paride]